MAMVWYYLFFLSLLVLLLPPPPSSAAQEELLSLRRRRRRRTNGLLRQCGSGCQKDSDCQGVLLCYPAEHPFVIAAGCSATGGVAVARQQQQQPDQTSYCIPQAIISDSNHPNHDDQATSTSSSSIAIISPKLAQFIGNPPNQPLQHCQADCDMDSQCAAGLICYRRESGDPAPGCYFDSFQQRGIDIAASVDLCIEKSYTEAPTSQPTHSPTTSPPTTQNASLFVTTAPGSSTANYQQPTKNSSQIVTAAPAVPTLSPTPLDTTITTTSSAPSSPAVLSMFVGNPPEKTLQLCEGDCDSDSECEGDLICYTRQTGWGAPGCQFHDDNTTTAAAGGGSISIQESHDVCVERGNKTRLRLYWQEGYYWQERTYEQFFCLQTSGNELVTQLCSGSSKQMFEFVHLPDGEALIKAVGANDGSTGSRCLSNRFLERCNPFQPAQRWNPNQVESWHGTYFELSNAQDGQNRCLSPHHHPRRNETVYMLNCRQERYFTTNAWQLWW